MRGGDWSDWSELIGGVVGARVLGGGGYCTVRKEPGEACPDSLLRAASGLRVKVVREGAPGSGVNCAVHAWLGRGRAESSGVKGI